MEIRQLMAFIRVADLRSYTRAAESLSLTQPSISHQLRLLEEELGQKLVEVQGRRVTLTPAGEMLKPMVERLLQSVEDCRRAMENVEEGERGVVNIAAIGSSTVYILPELLYQFRMAHPQIEVSLRTAGGDEIREMVQRNQVDLGVVGSHISVSGLERLSLYEDRIVPFVHGGHPLAKCRRVKFAELAKEPLIQLGTWRSWHNYVLSLFRQVGVKPLIRLHLDSIDAVKRMVERGLGFTVIPHTTARDEMEEGKLVALTPSDIPPLKRQVLLIRRKRKVLSKAQEKFIRFLQAKLPKMDM